MEHSALMMKVPPTLSLDLPEDFNARINEDLRCPTCRINGAATWEEAPAVPHARARNRLRGLVGLTAGFKSVDKGGRDGLTITCAGCGARITSD